MLSKNSSVSRRVRLRQLVVEAGEQQRVGVDLLDVLQPQPLRGKARRHRFGARIGEHPPDLLLEGRRRVQRVGGRQLDQLGVRHRVPDEERQPRRQVDVADPVGLPGLGQRRRALEAEHELRAGQQRLQRRLDAGLEVVALASLAVELHQRFDVFVVRRPAVGLAGEAGQNLARARNLVGRRGRAADEHLAAARRVGDAGDLVRPGDAEVADVRQHGDAGVVAVLGVGQRVVDRRHQVVDDAVELLDEGGGDVLRAGLDVNLRRQQVQPVLVGLGHLPVDVEQRDALAVDARDRSARCGWRRCRTAGRSACRAA